MKSRERFKETACSFLLLLGTMIFFFAFLGGGAAAAASSSPAAVATFLFLLLPLDGPSQLPWLAGVAVLLLLAFDGVGGSARSYCRKVVVGSSFWAGTLMDLSRHYHPQALAVSSFFCLRMGLRRYPFQLNLWLSLPCDPFSPSTFCRPISDSTAPVVKNSVFHIGT